MISYKRHQEHIIRAAWDYLEAHPRGIGKRLLKKAEKFFGKQKDRQNNPTAELNKAVKKNYKLRLAPGKIYSFRYNALWAKKLPYYDRYPYIIVLKRNNKNHTFIGLNLHYIEPYFREELIRAIDHLYTQGMDRYFVKDFFGDITKWARRIAKPCLHTYRMDRVMNLRYWNIPTLMGGWANKVADQTFIRSGIRSVWMDSRKKMFRGARWKQRQLNKKKAEKQAKARLKKKMQAKSALMKKAKAKAKQVPKSSVKPGQNKSRTKSKTSRASKARTGKRCKR